MAAAALATFTSGVIVVPPETRSKCQEYLYGDLNVVVEIAMVDVGRKRGVPYMYYRVVHYDCSPYRLRTEHSYVVGYSTIGTVC